MVSKPLIKTGLSILGMKNTPNIIPLIILIKAEITPKKRFQKKKKKLMLYHIFLQINRRNQLVRSESVNQK